MAQGPMHSKTASSSPPDASGSFVIAPNKSSKKAARAGSGEGN